MLLASRGFVRHCLSSKTNYYEALDLAPRLRTIRLLQHLHRAKFSAAGRTNNRSLTTSVGEASYNCTVRRVLSFTLLLLFSLPLISPVLPLTAGSDANLPACCRRNGAHHCTKLGRPTDPSAPGANLSAIPQHCPAYPAVVTSARHGDLSFHTASLIFRLCFAFLVVIPQGDLLLHLQSLLLLTQTKGSSFRPKLLTFFVSSAAEKSASLPKALPKATHSIALTIAAKYFGHFLPKNRMSSPKVA